MRVRIQSAVLTVLAFGLFAAPVTPARAALELDPDQVYATMQQAFALGSSHGWQFRDQQLYLLAVLDAGRAYSLRRPSDPQYANIANVAIDIASRLHYDPLTEAGYELWYVREAAAFVLKENDPVRSAQASALLTRLDAFDGSAEQAALIADEDAQANVAAYPREPDALLSRLVTDLRAFNLTKDARYRSLALELAARPEFPIAHVPDPEDYELYTVAQQAASAQPGYTDADVAAAKTVSARRKAVGDLPVIGRVRAIPHALRMSLTAPADEYFGRTRLSVIGINNFLKDLSQRLSLGWGARLTGQAMDVADALDDLHRQYPRDFALPGMLYAAYQLLGEIDSPRAHTTQAYVRNILVLEYPDSSQARDLLGVRS